MSCATSSTESSRAHRRATLDIVNPSTGEVYATSPRSGPADVDAATHAARKAFDQLRRANGTDYGLALSVWTSKHKPALRMSPALDFGCVWVNCHIPLIAEMPHGGFKQSGYGKDLSQYSLDEYTRIKHVMSSIGG